MAEILGARRKNCRARRHTRVPPYGEVHRRWGPPDFGRTETSAPTGYWYTKCVGQARVPCRWGGGTHGCRPTEKCTAGGGRRFWADRDVRPYGMLLYKVRRAGPGCRPTEKCTAGGGRRISGGQIRPSLRMGRRCGRRKIKKHRSHEKISGEAVFYVDKADASMVQ